MPARGLSFYAGRILLIELSALLVGWLLGYPLLALLLATAGLLAWHVYHLVRLQAWLRSPGTELPQGRGAWADVFDGLNTIETRNRRRLDRDRAMIGEFTSLTDAFPDATLVIDHSGAITWFNRAAQGLLGLRDPNDLGQQVTNLIRDPGFANWLAVQGEVRSPLEMASPRGDDRWLTVNAVPFRGDQRLMVLRDTTGVHRLERIRRDFVANISHELRTPLTVIQGYLELLDEHPSSDVAEAVRKMLSQTVQMQALLDDLLELSRVQSGELKEGEEVVDVPALLMQLKEQAEELSRGAHAFEFDIDPDLQLTGHAPDLESAFGNLIGNAVKYTPANGRISVSWREGRDGPRFRVADTGIGIPKRDIPRITERFYRVGSDRGRKTGGTGLGLAIVKHVLNAHKARLLIESELGEGSVFTCDFPSERMRRKSA
ncbi:MAG: phosphate regulon sensor histidine kinase PhoR [Xanthomonadales bacterium]